MSTKSDEIEYEITVGIYCTSNILQQLCMCMPTTFRRAILHLLQVRSMHTGNQSKAAGKLFSFHLNRSCYYTSLCSGVFNIYPQAVKVHLTTCASSAIRGICYSLFVLTSPRKLGNTFPHFPQQLHHFSPQQSSPADSGSVYIEIKLTNGAELIKQGSACATSHFTFAF